MTAPFRLDSKTAVVTGGASGIGEATCRAFAGAGASVVIVDVNRPAAEALSRELPGSSILTFDITEEAAVRQALGTLKSLDILVNNAGIGLVGNIEETWQVRAVGTRDIVAPWRRKGERQRELPID